MNVDNLQLLIAAVLPVVIRLLKNVNYPDSFNAVIALVVYVIAGTLAVVTSSQPFDLNNVIPSITLFTTVGTVAYQLFWKNLENDTDQAN